jgi:hypothetical protein
MTMSCEHMEELLPPYVDGNLRADEALEVERHLDDCEGCAAMLGYLRRADAVVASWPQVPRRMQPHLARIDEHVLPRIRRRRRFPSMLPSAARVLPYMGLAAFVLVIGAAVLALSVMLPQLRLDDTNKTILGPAKRPSPAVTPTAPADRQDSRDAPTKLTAAFVEAATRSLWARDASEALEYERRARSYIGQDYESSIASLEQLHFPMPPEGLRADQITKTYEKPRKRGQGWTQVVRYTFGDPPNQTTWRQQFGQDHGHIYDVSPAVDESGYPALALKGPALADAGQQERQVMRTVGAFLLYANLSEELPEGGTDWNGHGAKARSYLTKELSARIQDLHRFPITHIAMDVSVDGDRATHTIAYPGTWTQRYELELQDGAWKIAGIAQPVRAPLSVVETNEALRQLEEQAVRSTVIYFAERATQLPTMSCPPPGCQTEVKDLRGYLAPEYRSGLEEFARFGMVDLSETGYLYRQSQASEVSLEGNRASNVITLRMAGTDKTLRFDLRHIDGRWRITRIGQVRG